jgi:hypothetical protein
MKTVSEYMMALHKELVEQRNIADNTASQYIRSLYSLNNNRPFTNLSWLKNKESVEQRLSEFADSTQKTILSVVVASLSLVKDKATYKKIYSHYYNEMMMRSKEERDKDTSIKTEKQDKNWLSWDVVKAHQQRLTDEMRNLPAGSKLTPGQWDTCLSFMLLSLYTEFDPRRNQDYQYMYVNKNEGKQSTSNEVNYLILDTKEFIFRKYKTAKTHGEQRFPVPDALFKDIELYMSHHPIWNVIKGKKITSKMGFPLLCSHDGSPLLAVNAITRILNRIFGRRVGSTMLRHIYLSNKYDVSEMNETAEKMGHTGAVQREYLKGGETVQEVTVPMASDL